MSLTVANVAVEAAPAAAVPGTPGTTQAPIPVFTENFENGMTNAAGGAKSYTTANGANQYVSALGQTYTGSTNWINGNRCNGVVLSYNNATSPSWASTPLLTNKCSQSVGVQSYNGIRTLARGMGAFTGNGDNEHIVSSYTECALDAAGNGTTCDVIPSGPTNGVLFQTTAPHPVTPGHFYTFGVDTVYGNCSNFNSPTTQADDPQYQFQLIDSTGAATNVGSILNGCRPSPTRQTFVVNRPAAVGTSTTMTAHVSSLMANAPFQYNGSDLGVKMYNASGVTLGNDGGFDNIRILDVTPQLDKSFSPAVVRQGQATTLTFTVTNTSDLLAKNGWRFVDSLPSGLSVAGPLGGTCVRTAGSATGGTIDVTGNLAAGAASCTITVNVISNTPGVYNNSGCVDNTGAAIPNCTSNFPTTTGINPPSTAPLTVLPVVDLSIAKSTALQSYTPGQPITYSVTVHNNGPSDAVGATVTDPLPASITGASWTCAVTAPGTPNILPTGPTACPASGTGSISNTVRVNTGGTITYTITGTVAPGTTGPLVNTAKVVPAANTPVPNQPGGGPNPVPGSTTPVTTVDPGCPPAPGAGCSATVTTAGSAIDALKSITSVTDTNSNGITDTTDVIHYSIVATNTGQSTLTGVTVTDALTAPAGPAMTLSCTPTTPATLAPGAAVTCTGNYTVTLADTLNGSVNNTATATGTPPSGPAVTDTSTATQPITSAPDISVLKTASPTSYDSVGDTITYNFEVTNEGNVPLTGIGVNEVTFTGTGTHPVVTCPSGPVAPGASVDCTATYAVTQADLNAGSIDNTATATGTPPSGPAVVSDPSSATVTADENPDLTLVKSASPTSVSAANDVVTYSFAVTNSGNVTLTDITVQETAFSGTGTAPVVTCPTAPVAPGDTVTCTASYSLTQTDINAGIVTNTATATGTSPSDTDVTSDPSTAVVTADSAPGISIVKSATPNDAASFTVGQVITYNFVATNTGNVTLTDVAINETSFDGAGTLSAISCPPGTASLAPGASVTCTATYTLEQDDIDRGDLTNEATATGTPPTGPDVTSPPSEVAIPSDPEPALTLVKSATPTTVSAVGQQVTYSFTVMNSGNVTLTDIDISETVFTGTGTPPVATCPPEADALVPGEQVVCTATYAATQADLNAGQITNTAVADAQPPTGGPIETGPSTAIVTATSTPGLTIEKSASPTTITDMSEIAYTFVVTNTGNVTLADVVVSETSFSGTGTPPDITCPAGLELMAPGDEVTCTATYTPTQADLDAGQITNTAVATGNPPAGEPTVSDPSTAVVTATPTPALSIVKSATPTTVNAVGDVVSYSFEVTNTGNVTLTGVAVHDFAFTGTGTPPEVECPAEAATMAPNDVVICTASYEVTQADIDATQITNTATATGTPPSGPSVTSPPSTATVDAEGTPGIALEKTASPNDATALVVGQDVTYSFEVTNTGTVTLTDITVVEGSFTGSGTLSAVSCPPEAASLAPGDSVTCTATYTVEQEDVDRGSIVNDATATGLPPGGETIVSPPSEVELDAEPDPSLSLVKSAEPEMVANIGEIVNYSFVVTNTGNVTLTDITVNEGDFSGAGTTPEIECPAEVASLAPGDSVTCTASYTIVQADLDAGSVTNSATATGNPPTGGSVDSPPSTAVVDVSSQPALTIAKSANPTVITSVGQHIDYSFVVTNTGNVTLADITVNETEFSGTGEALVVTCPSAADSLAPTASVTCTASYTATQADVNSGEITNTATATGTPPSGSDAVSEPSTATVTVEPNAALTVVKSATPANGEPLSAGDTVTYSFLVTNTGNVTLTDVAIDEIEFTGAGDAPEVVCPDEATSMNAGDEVICTAEYTVTQADVDAGVLTNTATATGTPPGDEPDVTSPPSTATVTLTPAPALSIVKSATPNDATSFTAGTQITYTFVITNTGNVTMTDVAPSETEFTGSGSMSAITCPAEAAEVAPGDQVTCTAEYTLTQADVDAGSVENTAIATGTPPVGPPTESTPSTVQLPSDPEPAISLVKVADKQQVTKAGQLITYTFTMTNTGNVTVHDPTVAEGEFSGSGELSQVTCPPEAAVLAPGAQVECTATYRVEAADLTGKPLTNTATATGTTTTGTPPVSKPSTATVETVKPGVPPVPPVTPSSGPLAVTGSGSGLPLIGGAALLLLLGGATIVFARSRRFRSHRNQQQGKMAS